MIAFQPFRGRGGIKERFDLIITDPPYGDGISYGRYKKNILGNEDESINYKILPLLYNALKPDKSCYIFTNWKFEQKIRNFIEEYTDFKIRMLIALVKHNWGLGYGFRNQTEYCIVLEKGHPHYNLSDFSNAIKLPFINHDAETHPHQKPTELIEKIIEHSSAPGDLILDCFGGSGTTAIACYNTKRNFVLIEKDPKYYKLSVERLNMARVQPRLF